jgi:peptide-methionine (S)-S-oxide reductase
MEKAIFGAGCFWGVEAAFRRVSGVFDVAVGYSGGSSENPSYEEVCSGRSGHAEVVQVEFDASIVAYEDLLAVFWDCHDPTTRDRQGPDVGTQYRSEIFFLTPEQQTLALASRDKLEASSRLANPVVTEVTPAGAFWRAEEYHQRYLEKRGVVH